MATNATVTILETAEIGDRNGKKLRKQVKISFVATGNPTLVVADFTPDSGALFEEIGTAHRTETTATAATFTRATAKTSIANATITTGTWEMTVWFSILS